MAETFSANKLINTKGTTYRALSEADKASITDLSKAIALMIQHPALIKRPVWDFGNGKFFLGYDEKELEEVR